jgi:hypothetical protein
MDDPITLPSGYIYNRKTIQDLFTTLDNPASVPCPFTRQHISQAEFKVLATSVATKNRLQM